jgi:hypothetical protein
MPTASKNTRPVWRLHHGSTLHSYFISSSATGGVAQWYRTCFASAKASVQTPFPPKRELHFILFFIYFLDDRIKSLI